MTASAVLSLLVLNAWIIARAFKTEWVPWMSSIEGSYIGLSRWIQGHWLDLGWNPLWYGGVPFENSYPPLLHLLVAAWGQLARMSVARSHHVVSAAAYCLGPVAVFCLVYKLSGSRWKAFIAGWVYSLVSFSAFLMPSIAADMNSVWNGRRIEALLGYGEGPHVTSMTLLTFALAAIAAALEKGNGWRIVLAAVLTAATAMTNWLGSFALGCAVVALVLARPRVEWQRLLAIGAIAYGLAAPWIRPSTIETVQRNAQILGNYKMGAAQYAYLGVWLGVVVAGGLLLRRTRWPVAARFAALFLVLMAVPPLGWEWFHQAYAIPQAFRYHLEMEMAIAICAGLILGSQRPRVIAGVAAGLAALAWVQIPVLRHYTRIHLDPFDITQTTEYQTARWLDAKRPGVRVLALGSTQFWMGAFNDCPQLGGGFAQARHNPTIDDAVFSVVYPRSHPNDVRDLLRAYGVQVLVVNGPKSRTAFQDFQKPESFVGVLPVLRRDGDDIIYEAGSRSSSLAHVMTPGDLVVTPEVRGPHIARYVAAIENPAYPDTTWRWLSAGRAHIDAQLASGQLVAVQVNWHPGWRATANGARAEIRRDGLGLMAIETKCNGQCSIDLEYTPGVEGWAARLLCAAALIACVFLLIH